MGETEKRIRQYEEILRLAPRHLEAIKRITITEELSLKDDLYIHVFAPALVEFVEWVLDKARQAGEQRLYFLARDGYLMYVVAKNICELQNINIDCRYIRLSRYSIRTAEYHLDNSHAIDKICSRGIDVTFDKIMRRGALQEDEIKHIASLTGYRDKRGEVLSKKEIAGLKDELSRLDTFKEYVNNHARDAFPAAKAFLEQEGLMDDVPCALVDSGWIGTLQESIRNIAGKDRIKGYYFGLYETPAGTNEGDYVTFFFGPKDHTKRKVYFSNCLFETIYSAPDGMTMGYRNNGNRVEAILSENDNPNKEALLDEQALIEKYLQVYLAAYRYKKASSDSMVVDKLFALAMGNPTTDEVNTFGDRLFCDDVLESQMQCVAARVDDSKVKLLTAADSAWVEGSIVRKGRHINKYLRRARIYKWIGYVKRRIK